MWTSAGLIPRLLTLLLSGCSLLETSWAQNRGQPTLPYPEGSDITYQWNYSCPRRTVCGFTCPGAGTAPGARTPDLTHPVGVPVWVAHATKLTVYLGKMPVGTDQFVQVLFYSYATAEVSSGSGFSLNTGLGTLACQVSGMTLDYSGPPKSDHKY